LRIARRSTPWESDLQTAGNLTVGRRAVMEGQVTHPRISQKSQISEDPADRACSTFTGHAPTITNPVKPALCRGSGHVPDGPPHRSTLDPTASEESV
jgi:hypothetical protein